MAAQPAGELLRGSTYEIPHLWAGAAAMLSIPRRQMSAAAARGEGRTGEDRSRGCWLCQSQYLVLRIVYFTCKKGHSLFPFSSLWKEFSSPLLLIPRLHQARVNSPKPNASSKAIPSTQKRIFREWPGGSKGQKSFFWSCLLAPEYWVGPLEAIHRKLFQQTDTWKKIPTLQEPSSSTRTPHPVPNQRLHSAGNQQLNSSRRTTQVMTRAGP